MKLHKPLLRAIQASDAKAFAPIDTSPIDKWAEKNISLKGAYAISGQFSIGKSTYLIPVLDAYKNHSIREIVILGPTQGGKSMAMDISLMWSIANRPGPSMWIMQGNKVAEEHAESRLVPSFKDTPAVQDYLPSYRDISKDCINFSHMSLYIHGPSEKRLQSKSIMNIFGSELWLWPQGSLDWAKKRTKHFFKYDMSKIILESQGGTEDSELDMAFQKGTMEYWHVPCPKCNHYFIPDIEHMNCSGSAWNQLRDIKNEDGTYNYGLLEEKLTMQCPECKHMWQDSEQVKAMWSEKGKYVQLNPHPVKGHKSFSWNSFVFDPWMDIVYEFIEATRMQKKGMNENLLNFFQQRLAKNISIESLYAKNKFVKADVNYNPKERWEGEVVRFLTIDCQEDKFVCLVRAWKKNGDSRLLWYGYLHTEDELLEKQKEWGVPYVWIDTGHRTKLVYEMCIRNKWFGVKGVAEKNGFIKEKIVNKKTGKKVKTKHFCIKSEQGGDPTYTGKGQRANLYLFCVNPIKDILCQLRDRKTHIEWQCLPSADYDIEEYNKQMFSESKKKVVNRYGGVNEFYVKIKHDKPNDLWDNEVYQIGAALLHPDIDIKESSRAPMLTQSTDTPEVEEEAQDEKRELS